MQSARSYWNSRSSKSPQAHVFFLVFILFIFYQYYFIPWVNVTIVVHIYFIYILCQNSDPMRDTRKTNFFGFVVNLDCKFTCGCQYKSYWHPFLASSRVRVVLRGAFLVYETEYGQEECGRFARTRLSTSHHVTSGEHDRYGILLHWRRLVVLTHLYIGQDGLME